MTESRRAIMLRSALVTPLCLIGTFFVGALLGSLIFNGLPGHMQDEARIAAAAGPALICVLAGGALWGRAMARIAHAPDSKRMVWAGALGYGPAVIAAALSLTTLEQLIVEQHRGPALPIHVVFTLLFSPAAAVVAAVCALALGIALRRPALAIGMALACGATAGLTFLGVDLLMDAVGYRVGAPGAADRATMLTVMLTGNVVASLAGGALIGLFLSRLRRA